MEDTEQLRVKIPEGSQEVLTTPTPVPQPAQGDTVLIQFCGSTQFARLQGRAFITDDGEAIEGEALDDVVVIGRVRITILSTMQDDKPVI